MAGEYLLEVRAEEIPARMLEPAVRHLATRTFEELMALGLAPKEVEAGFTPRRLVLMLRGLPEKEKDRREQEVGPPAHVAWKDGEPTKALEGFAKRCGVEPDALERIETEKGEYVAATLDIPGRPTPEVLAGLVPRVLQEISWAKQMRWGGGEGPWVRPVHGVVSLFDGEVTAFQLFGLDAGRTTVGHPVLSPEPFEVDGIQTYLDRLGERHIEVRPEPRKKTLAGALRDKADELGGELVEDDELLDKLTAICEIPGIMAGSFAKDFLELPREVLIASLKDHQSAFTVETPAGDLLPHFLTVMDRPDDPAGRVCSGNEWVVTARLEDARFFYGEDKKTRLAARAGDLEHLTFQEKLGSYADKAKRIAELAELLCNALGWKDEIPAAVEAASLLKADLTTAMVGEFPSLQGVIGGIYTREEGYPEEVWQAIYDQYLPASIDDEVPRGRIGKVVSLADRIDTLVGIFGLSLIPTGSRDPFGLRRAAQGVVRIALEGEMPLDLDLVAAKAARLYGDRLERSGEQILDTLRPFLYDRIRYLLGHLGYAYDEIEAALAVGGDDLPDLRARVEALHTVREDESFLSVALAAKRIVNIVKDQPEHSLKPEAFVEPAEKALYEAHKRLKGEIEELAAAREYEKALAKVGEMAEVLDTFFVEVLVMDENERLRHNRIALLQAIHRVLIRIARLTEMVVERKKEEG